MIADIYEAVLEHINTTTQWHAVLGPCKQLGNQRSILLYHSSDDQYGWIYRLTIDVRTMTLTFGTDTATLFHTYDLQDPTSLGALTDLLTEHRNTMDSLANRFLEVWRAQKNV